MDRIRVGRGPIARVVGALAVLLTICTSAVVLQVGEADAAPAARRCWAWSGNTPYKGAGITFFRGYYDIEWCGVGSKVTEFRVKRCEAGSLNSAFAKNPGSDCRPRDGLNGSALRIFGDMSADHTVSYANGVQFGPGRMNVHYEMTVYPDGRIVGQTY